MKCCKKVLAVIIMASMMPASFCSCGTSNATTSTEESSTVISSSETSETSETETKVVEQNERRQSSSHKITTFGHYEQDGDESNGPEPIEWLILAEEDDRMLLVSRYSLDYQPYNTDYTDVTWETCSLRKWLNEEFINAAFDASEQEQILTVVNTNPDNTNFEAWGIVEGGNDTEDRVFLLSADEADQYFANDDERSTGPCEWWWLRSPGFHSTHATVVILVGEIFTRGHMVNFNYNDHGVRPALWLELSE